MGIGMCLRSKTYKATALTRIIPTDASVVLGDSASNHGWGPTVTVAQQNVERFNSLIQDDKPGGFLARALHGARLLRPIQIDPKAKDPRYEALHKHLFVNPESDELFSVNLTWDQPQECERLLSALQEQFIEDVGRSQQAQAVATAEFLERQISSYERRMRGAEQALIDYKQRNAGQLPEAQTADFTALNSLRTRLDELEITSKDNELKSQALKKRIAQITPMRLWEQTTRDSPTAIQIRELQARRSSLLADGWLPTSVRVQSVDVQIESLKKQMEVESKSDAASAGRIFETKLQSNSEYQALTQQLTEVNIAQTTQQSQLKQVRQQIAQYEARTSRIPAAERELADKMRNYSVLKTQYEHLLQRREDARMKANLDKVSARSTLRRIGVIFARPTLDKKKKLVFLAAGLFLGLVVGIAMVFLSEWTDHSLRYAFDAERVLRLPVLVNVADSKELRCLPGKTRQ
ncbi:MAG TPA: hypothetical protein VGR43_00560 [Dehalococcoidia bacterium]|nr:hypothetical protein [Dehalococcoidia bacterium]